MMRPELPQQPGPQEPSSHQGYDPRLDDPFLPPPYPQADTQRPLRLPNARRQAVDRLIYKTGRVLADSADEHIDHGLLAQGYRRGIAGLALGWLGTRQIRKGQGSPEQ